MVQCVLLMPVRAMPSGSPASRLCATCSVHAPGGLFGPPTWAIVGDVGAYERVRHDDRWYCLTHGLELWDHWRATVHHRAARRAQIAAWLRRDDLIRVLEK